MNDISKLTLSDLSEAFKANKMEISEGLKHLRAFAEKHKLTDSEALEAFGKAKKVFK
jgi:DNA-binding transcriptional regulator GbsR (MarR family)